MHSDDPQSPDPQEAQVAIVEPAATVPPGLLPARAETVTLVLAEPEMLIEGIRHLQQRIPEFVQLSVREQRSMASVAHLDPEFIEVGLDAAGAWEETQVVLQRSAEDLRKEKADTQLWDQVEREMAVLTKGIAAANLKRKHRLGRAILRLYKFLGFDLNSALPRNTHMRPYYEQMERAYNQRRKAARKTAKKEEPETPEE